MKANELRIENKVFRNREVITVTPNDIYELSIYEDIAHDFEPIPLTGEWLLRLDMPECGSTRDLIGSYDVWFERSGNALFLNTETSSRKVDYVHQAQNIYFALKGEELTLTPL